jgi:exopolysaccharide production protein ExoQ
VALVVLAALALLPVVFAYDDLEQSAQTFQAQVLHKDASLTGRTELWTAATSVIAESPVLGHGYNAFWQQGNVDAEALWRTNGIASRTGFNFHNQFLDSRVDLGDVGLVFLVGTLIYVGVGSIWRAITSPTLSTAFTASLLLALYLRLPVESTLIGAWNLATFLWVSVGVSAYTFGDKPSPAEVHPRVGGRATKLSWRSRHDRLRTAPRSATRENPVS